MIFLYSSLFPSDFNVHVDNSSNTLAPGPDLTSKDLVLHSPSAIHSHGHVLHLSIPVTPKPHHCNLSFKHLTVQPPPPIFQFSTFSTWTSAVSSLTLLGSTVKGSYFLFTLCHLSPGLTFLLTLLNSVVYVL